MQFFKQIVLLFYKSFVEIQPVRYVFWFFFVFTDNCARAHVDQFTKLKS